MSIPSHDDYLKSSATWRGEHQGVAYSLNHHGIADYNRQGTWCFYIHLTEEIFLRSDSFAEFDREPTIRELSAGRYHESFDYYDVPDFGFHCGITFYERTTYVGKYDGLPKKALKIGCDYNHLWDEESGKWEGREDVECDAKRLIEKLVAAHPVKTRCGYTGRLDAPDQFYTARNGTQVHKSQIDTFSEENWPTWMPAAPDAVSEVEQAGTDERSEGVNT